MRENVTSLFLSLKRVICNFPDDIKALGEIAREPEIPLIVAVRSSEPILPRRRTMAMTIATRNTAAAGKRGTSCAAILFLAPRFLRRLFLNERFAIPPTCFAGPSSFNVWPVWTLVDRGARDGGGEGREARAERKRENQREFELSGRSVRKVRGVGERRRKDRRCAVEIDVKGWRKRGRRRREGPERGGRGGREGQRKTALPQVRVRQVGFRWQSRSFGA